VSSRFLVFRKVTSVNAQYDGNAQLPILYTQYVYINQLYYPIDCEISPHVYMHLVPQRWWHARCVYLHWYTPLESVPVPRHGSRTMYNHVYPTQTEQRFQARRGWGQTDFKPSPHDIIVCMVTRPYFYFPRQENKERAQIQIMNVSK